MGKFIDLTGQRFGRYKVIRRVGNSKSGRVQYLCKCDCGNERIVFANGLRRGTSQSCGCYHNEQLTKRNFRHGLLSTKLYRTWRNIQDRCYYDKRNDFKYYGGRGIKVCDEWRDSFQAFYDWAMANG